MKSLEIVNDIEKHLKDYLDDLKMTKEDFKLRKFSGVEHIFERLEEKISEVQTSMNNAQQIKQYLDVLEIIRKKKVDVNLLTTLLEEELTLEEILYIMNDEYCKLTMEELLKLKQWLEVNENE